MPITQPSTEQGGVDASLHVCLPSKLSGRQSLGPAQPWGHHPSWAPRMTGYSSTGALGPLPARSHLPHPEPWSHGALSSLTVSCFKIDSGHFLKCLWNLKNDMSRCVLAFCHFVCLKNVPFAGSRFVVLELHSSMPTEASLWLYWFGVVAFNSFYVPNYSFAF